MKIKTLLLKNKLKQAKKINIYTHVDPDGDAVGSAVLFKELIKCLKPGLQIKIICDKNYKKPLQKYIQENCSSDESIDNQTLTIVVDSSTLTRVYNGKQKLKKPDINIDHHVDNENFAELNIVVSDAASAGVILYRIARAWKIKLNKKMAEALYLSLSSDTGNFAFANTNAEAFAIAHEAVSHGAKPYETYKMLNEQMDLQEMNDLGKALNQAESHLKGRLILSTIGAKSGLDNRVLIDFLRRETKAEVALVLVEKDDYIKLSFRSKGKINVSKIAADFNGGGHVSAAAGRINCKDLNEAKKILLRYFEKNVFQ